MGGIVGGEVGVAPVGVDTGGVVGEGVGTGTVPLQSEH